MAAKKTPAKKKKKVEDPEKENGERWLLTYADLITLLFAFFVVLWAMSQVDPKKFDELPDNVYLSWRRKGWVGLVYAHLLSSHRWQYLSNLAPKG